MIDTSDGQPSPQSLPNPDRDPSSRGVAYWLFVAVLSGIDAGLGFLALVVTAEALQTLFAVMFVALLILIVLLLAARLRSVMRAGV